MLCVFVAAACVVTVVRAPRRHTETGRGLAPQLEGRVFEPYVRAPRLKQAGMGLGLAKVKRLARGHGGALGVRSVPERGCVFWFELPRGAALSVNGAVPGVRARDAG